MGSKMNRSTYEQMIAENLAWLSGMPQCPERVHIEQIVKDSVFRLYDQADRIATLEAEKAERERQEPVGFLVRYKGERTWGTIITHRAPDSFELRECEIRNLYAHPLALREPTEEECREIWRAIRRTTATDQISGGRAMWQAVREVMT